jgi:hypothetical protein
MSISPPARIARHSRVRSATDQKQLTRMVPPTYYSPIQVASPGNPRQLLLRRTAGWGGSRKGAGRPRAGRPRAPDRRGRRRCAGPGKAGARDPDRLGDQPRARAAGAGVGRPVPRATVADAARGAARAGLRADELSQAPAVGSAGDRSLLVGPLVRWVSGGHAGEAAHLGAAGGPPATNVAGRGRVAAAGTCRRLRETNRVIGYDGRVTSQDGTGRSLTR